MGAAGVSSRPMRPMPPRPYDDDDEGVTFTPLDGDAAAKNEEEASLLRPQDDFLNETMRRKSQFLTTRPEMLEMRSCIQKLKERPQKNPTRTRKVQKKGCLSIETDAGKRPMYYELVGGYLMQFEPRGRRARPRGVPLLPTYVQGVEALLKVATEHNGEVPSPEFIAQMESQGTRFDVYTPTRILKLYAETLDDQKAWIHAIQASLDSHFSDPELKAKHAAARRLRPLALNQEFTEFIRFKSIVANLVGAGMMKKERFAVVKKGILQFQRADYDDEQYYADLGLAPVAAQEDDDDVSDSEDDDVDDKGEQRRDEPPAEGQQQHQQSDDDEIPLLRRPPQDDQEEKKKQRRHRKKGQHQPRFLKKYCVLRSDGTLVYGASAVHCGAKKQPEGVISLAHLHVDLDRTEIAKTGDMIFSLVTPMRTFIVRAPHLVALEEWLRSVVAVTEAIRGRGNVGAVLEELAKLAVQEQKTWPAGEKKVQKIPDVDLHTALDSDIGIEAYLNFLQHEVEAVKNPDIATVLSCWKLTKDFKDLDDFEDDEDTFDQQEDDVDDVDDPFLRSPEEGKESPPEEDDASARKKARHDATSDKNNRRRNASRRHHVTERRAVVGALIEQYLRPGDRLPTNLLAAEARREMIDAYDRGQVPLMNALRAACLKFLHVNTYAAFTASPYYADLKEHFFVLHRGNDSDMPIPDDATRVLVHVPGDPTELKRRLSQRKTSPTKLMTVGIHADCTKAYEAWTRLPVDPNAIAATTIGRDPKADLPINDKRVSREHARVDTHPDGTCLFLDLGSSHGSKINGRPVSKREPLHVGDVIKLGRTKILFTIIPHGADEPIK